MVIKATLISDDKVAKVEFNVIHWFQQATDIELETYKIRKEDIADFMREHDRNVDAFFDYVDSKSVFKEEGWTLNVDEKSADNWINEICGNLVLGM